MIPHPMVRHPEPTKSELLTIQIEAVRDQLESLQETRRETLIIERAADKLLENKEYEESEEGLEKFAEDLSDEIRNICSEEAKNFAPEDLRKAGNWC